VAGRAYIFGPFRLEAEERRLLRDGSLVPLVGKAFDLLVLLVEGAGALQQQRALVERLWPDTVVAPNNLQYNASIVRRALENARGVALQTVRGQGYRLVANVSRVDAPAAPAEPAPTLVQRTYFCKAEDGTRLAFAKLGEGPPLVKASNWLTHLELDLQSVLWKPWMDVLSRGRCLVRFDARGNGLSDWNTPTMSPESFVTDLAAILDAAGVRRAPILGLSQGAATAVAFAARHPERVSGLILVGGCARGWRVKGDPDLIAQYEALMVIMRQAWGAQNPAFRQLFTTAFFPDATPELVDYWNELQRQTTSPENAVKLLAAVGGIDVRADLPRVTAPTLVLHSRDDTIMPMSDGIELATGIRGAQFVPLDSKNHVLLGDEPAWRRFVTEIERFLAQETLGEDSA
jgi:pimeloyl-ACP methyl ester carboxylesterase/DNA-binding winged helix-turn-helix (wHTH) protein